MQPVHTPLRSFFALDNILTNKDDFLTLLSVSLKGTVSREFLLHIFFLNHLP
jgi:hypothetical protein